MERIPTWISVVAGAIMNGEGQLLLQQRPIDKQHGGLWEFPGGKVEPDETPRNALVRELNEELTIRVDPDALFACGFAESPPEGGHPGIVILLYTVPRWVGEPKADYGAELGWFPFDEASRLPLPPLDVRLLEGLRGRMR